MIPELKLWLNAFAPAEAVIPCKRAPQDQQSGCIRPTSKPAGQITKVQCGCMDDSPGTQPAGAASISCPLQTAPGQTQSLLPCQHATSIVQQPAINGSSAAASWRLLLMSSMMAAKAKCCITRQLPHLVPVLRTAGWQQKQRWTWHLWAQRSALHLQDTILIEWRTLPMPCARLHMQH